MPSLITSFPIWSARCYAFAWFFYSSQSNSAAWPVPGALCKAYSHLFDSMPLRCSSAYFCATPKRIPSVPSNSISDLFLAVLRSSISILCQSHLNRCLTIHTSLFRSSSSPVDSVPILCSAHHFGPTPHRRCPALRSALPWPCYLPLRLATAAPFLSSRYQRLALRFVQGHSTASKAIPLLVPAGLSSAMPSPFVAAQV